MTTSGDARSLPAEAPLEEPSAADEGSGPAQEVTVERLARMTGPVMLIGDTDTGKTTLCAGVVGAALAAGRRPAVVDADAGQSEIGPPTTLGLAMPDAGFGRLSDLKPRGLAFVGSTSPPGYLLEWVLGVRRLVDRAGALGADLILIDMPGLVSGPIGHRLNVAVAEAARPAACAMMEREGELRAIRRSLPRSIPIVRPAISSAAHPKSATVRRLRRRARYASYFAEAREWELAVDRVSIGGGSLFIGRSLRAPAREALQQSLIARLLHVERGEDGLRVVSDRAPSPADRAAVAERFGRLKVTWLEASRLRGALVGLLDADGDTLGIGSVARIDFRRRVLRIASPWLDPEAVRGMVWGTARALPDGAELEPLRRGDI